MSNRRVPLALSVFSGLAVALGCAPATTQMNNVWKDPAAVSTPLRKVAVICMTKDANLMQLAEAEAAQQIIKGAMVIPGYQVVSDADLFNREVLTYKLQEQGFDGVLVIRPAAVAERFAPVAAPYGTFSGYYDWAVPEVYAPAYLQGQLTVLVISTLYSLRTDRLVWSSTSRTFDVNSTRQAVTGVSRAVARRIQTDRLVI
jgi:hypothetical protein